MTRRGLSRAAAVCAAVAAALALASCDNPAGGNGGGGTPAWITGEGLWNVTTQEQVTLTGANTFVHQAFTHVNSAAATGQEFILAVEAALFLPALLCLPC